MYGNERMKLSHFWLATFAILPKNCIKKLRKEILSDENPITKDLKGVNCAICQDDFVPDGREVTMLGCHTFCSNCIGKWLGEYNDTCPICRKKILTVFLQTS